MSRPVLYALAVSAFLLTSCNHLQQMGTHRQIGPIKSGDAYLLRTSTKATQVFAVALPDVVGTSAEEGPDGSTRHLFSLADGAVVSIYHGTSPAPQPGPNPKFAGALGGKAVTWDLKRLPAGYRSATTLAEGPAFWQVVVSATEESRVREIAAHLASFRQSRQPWPDLVVSPSVSSANHMLLRGRAHCPPSRSMGRSHR